MSLVINDRPTIIVYTAIGYKRYSNYNVVVKPQFLITRTLKCKGTDYNVLYCYVLCSVLLY